MFCRAPHFQACNLNWMHVDMFSRRENTGICQQSVQPATVSEVDSFMCAKDVIYVIEYIACATHALHAATPHTVQLLVPACFGIYVDLQSTSLTACAAALGFRGLPFGCSFLASNLAAFLRPTGLDSRIACLTYSKLPLDNSM